LCGFRVCAFVFVLERVLDRVLDRVLERVLDRVFVFDAGRTVLFVLARTFARGFAILFLKQKKIREHVFMYWLLRLAVLVFCII
jgi:hypothetical protein